MAVAEDPMMVVVMVVMMMKRGRLWMRKGRLWNGNRDRKMDASDGRTRGTQGTRDEARLQPWDGARTAAAGKSTAAADKGTGASHKGMAAIMLRASLGPDARLATATIAAAARLRNTLREVMLRDRLLDMAVSPSWNPWPLVAGVGERFRPSIVTGRSYWGNGAAPTQIHPIAV
jgi:hypothetical protein